MRLILLLCLLLATCSEHPDPPQPYGRLIPVDPTTRPDYRGDVLYQGQAKP